MVASAIFITDLTGKPLISRNYRGDIPLTSAIDRFASYLNEVEDEMKKPVFHVDSGGEVCNVEDVGCSGAGGETFVYVQVSDHVSGRGYLILSCDHARVCVFGERERERRVGINCKFRKVESVVIVWLCGGALYSN